MSVSMLQMCLFNLIMKVSRNDFFYSCPVPVDQNVHHMSHVTWLLCQRRVFLWDVWLLFLCNELG